MATSSTSNSHFNREVSSPPLSIDDIVARPKLGGFDFYRSLGSPKYVLAPMVDHSELAFRMLCRRHGVHLAYTPMLHSANFLRDEKYRLTNFSTCPEDRPLFVQFCGNDPETLLRAAMLVQDRVDAIDINLGCPQNIAKRGHYGSFLMEDPQLIRQLVSTLHRHLSVPVTCKIRIFKEVDRTIAYARMLEEAGCQMLTVHGRTREMRGNNVPSADINVIKLVKESVKIPVFSNGNTDTFEDVTRNLEFTNAEGVMSGVGLLRNPALFSSRDVDPIQLAFEYLDLCIQYDPGALYIKGHLFKMLDDLLALHTDIRAQLHTCPTNWNSFKEIVDSLQS